MPINRYAFVQPKTNTDESYNDFFKSKKVKSIEHLTTKRYDDIEKISTMLQVTTHVCKANDKLTTIANNYYGNPRYWYLVALSNKLPNDFFLEDGKEINIYFPLEKVITFFNGR